MVKRKKLSRTFKGVLKKEFRKTQKLNKRLKLRERSIRRLESGEKP